MTELSQTAPNLAAVTEAIAASSVFQKKAVKRLLEEADQAYLDFAESVCRRMLEAARLQGGPAEPAYLAKAYLDYTKSIRTEEMFFAKEGRYRHQDFDLVYQNVYGRDDYMFDYVMGLGMTQIFWPNHYAIMRFYLDEFLPLAAGARTGAEVGVGHGLFHAGLLAAAGQCRTTMLDISPASLAQTKALIQASGLDPERAQARQVDVQKEIPLDDGSLDVLLMGELVEHLAEGERVMAEMAGKMAPGGCCFFTTAANAPAEDHLLLFRTSGEMRDFIARTGWEVVKEHLGTLKGMSVEKADAEGHNLNYAAALRAKA
jgi:SAM-dependent methyltransferase